MTSSGSGLLSCPICGARYGVRELRPATAYVCLRCDELVEGPERADRPTSLSSGAPVVYLYGGVGTPGRPLRPEGGAPTWDLRAQAGEDQDGSGSIGRYRLHAELGRGGMGVVYLAFDPDLGRNVALKVLLGGTRAGHDQVERFLREARSAARLDHPSIVRVHDIGRHEHRVFFTMELVDGPSLADVLEEVDRLPLREALRLASEVAAALQHAHDAGIVHRDVKPGNILVDTEGRPMVADFGLAKELEGDGRLTLSGQVLGTPSYMAPEQAHGGKVTARSDVYGLGAVLYEMVSGTRPYGDASGVAVLMRILEEEADPLLSFPPDVPRDAELICRMAMAREPERRYATCRDLANDIRRFLAGDPIVARPASVSYRSRLWLRRHRQRLGAVSTVIGLAVAAFATWTVWGWQSEGRAVQAHAREAQERLGTVDAQIEAALAEGLPQDAELALRVFVQDFAGTPAVAEAWLGWATRRRHAGDTRGEVEALATAYREAATPGVSARALIGLAGAFADQWRWDRLGVVLSTLAARFPNTTDQAEVARLRAQWAVATGDLGAAARELAAIPRVDRAGSEVVLPVLAALSRGVRTDHPGELLVTADLDGDGVDELVLGQGATLTSLRAGPELSVLERAHVPMPADWSLHVIPVRPGSGEPALLVVSTVPGPSEIGTAALYRWDGPELEAVLSWEEAAILDAVAADLDGDGRVEVWVGVGGYSRRILRLDRSVGGAWGRVQGYPSFDDLNSAPNALEVTDVDLDGSAELVVAAGAWMAYDLRAVRPSAERGDLEPVWRHKLGQIESIAVIEGPSPILVAAKSDRYPNVQIFPEPPHHGAPAGLYVFLGGDTDFGEIDFLPAPRAAGAAPTDIVLSPLVVGDFDGDGLDDLALGVSLGSGPCTWLLRQAPVGTFSGACVGGVEPLAAVEIDGDEASELAVRLSDDDRVWILGAGEGSWARAALPAPLPRPPPLSVRSDPALVEKWQAADTLGALGLPGQAAAELREAAAMAAGTEAEAVLQLRAAELLEIEGDAIAAAALFERAAADPAIAVVALDGALRCLLGEHRFEEAASVVRRIQEASPDDPERRAEAEAALGWLDPIRASTDAVVLTFDAPLDPEWQIEEPILARRAAGAAGLEVHASGPDTIARLPVRWGGGAVRLEVELRVVRTDWASGLTVALQPEGDPRPVLALTARAAGGGGLLQRSYECRALGGAAPLWDRPVANAFVEDAVVLWAEYVPELGHVRCGIEARSGETGPARVIEVAEPTPVEGGYELVLRGAGYDEPGETAGSVARIALRGPGVDVVRGADTSARLGGNLALANGDPEGALAVWPAADSGPLRYVLHRAGALADLGRVADARRLVAAAVRTHPSDASDAALVRVLRARPETWSSLLRSALPPSAWVSLLLADARRRGDPTTGDQAGAMRLVEDAIREVQTTARWDRAPRDRVLAEISALGLRADLLVEERPEAARRDLRRVLELVGSGGRPVTPGLEQHAVHAHELLARAEVALGRPDVGLEHARHARSLAPRSERLLESLRLDPGVAALADQPGWRDLLGP